MTTDILVSDPEILDPFWVSTIARRDYRLWAPFLIAVLVAWIIPLWRFGAFAVGAWCIFAAIAILQYFKRMQCPRCPTDVAESLMEVKAGKDLVVISCGSEVILCISECDWFEGDLSEIYSGRWRLPHQTGIVLGISIGGYRRLVPVAIHEESRALWRQDLIDRGVKKRKVMGIQPV